MMAKFVFVTIVGFNVSSQKWILVVANCACHKAGKAAHALEPTYSRLIENFKTNIKIDR